MMVSNTFLVVANIIFQLASAKSIQLHSPICDNLRGGELVEGNIENKSEESVKKKIAFVPSQVKVKNKIHEDPKGPRTPTKPTLPSSKLPQFDSEDFQAPKKNADSMIDDTLVQSKIYDLSNGIRNRVGKLPLRRFKPSTTRLQNSLKGSYGKAAESLSRIGTASWESLRLGPQTLDIQHTAGRMREESFKVLHKILGCTMVSTVAKSNGKPKLMLPVFALALFGTSLGFHSFLYFVSVGYSVSIGLISLFSLFSVNIIHRGNVPFLSNLHSTLAFIWSIRLTVFLLHREYVNWPEWHSKLVEVDKRTNTPSKIMVWLTCSICYGLMMLPCMYRLSSALDPSNTSTWGMLGKFGIGLQILGISVESIADFQKGSFKHLVGCRDRWCNVGLWNLSTHPNYLGEMMFWFGTYIGGIASYNHINRWLLSSGGLIFILMVLQNAINSLSAKQSLKYGFDEYYVEFRRTHSMFGPKRRQTRSNANV